MTLPTDFDSFAFGFDLTAANYSTPGSGGGTFANLVAGQEDWTRGSNIPSFTTKSGLEGLDFSNSINDIVQGRMRAMSEFTVLAIADVANAGLSHQIFGGLNTAVNTASLGVASGTVRASANGFNDAAVGGAVLSNTPSVLTASFSPVNETLYAQVNDGTAGTDSSWIGANPSTLAHHQAAIGAQRTSYMTGWVARILVFSRALHYRDDTALQSLIATEMATIGL